MVMICFNKAEDNLTWRIDKKALKYGEDLRLYCQVEKCCTKSAGWGKWTSDDKFDTIFIDVKYFLNDGSSKYGGGIEKTGWFLIIRNITKNDLNTSYSCTYGFQVSKKKMLLEEDAFFGPSTTILIEQGTKETEIIPDTFSIDGKQEILMKISHLIYM
ncbi:uncharacterized protein [Mytilus edulis]|uniref:uncharacterized protein n=1 Tax=Mytilus edulis TaxID=6550 RepID=UPI0039F07EBA